MGEVARLEDRERRGAADPVVGAERRAVGLDDVSVDDEADRVLREVVGGARVLLADHVDVALEDDDGLRLEPLRPGLADDDVPDLVDLRGEAEAGGDRDDVGRGGGFVLGAAGDRGEGGEVVPEQLRLETGEGVGHEGVSFTRPRSEERRVGKECRYRWWP